MKYFNAIQVGNLKYSIDMIRYKFFLTKYYQEELYCLIKQIQSYDYFASNKKFHYRELFKIKIFDLKYSYSLGLGFNGLKSEDKKLCFIEFNPNKLQNQKELYIVLRFLINRKIDLELVSYDIAIDMPYNKKFVSLVKDKRLYKKHCYDSQGVNVTEYLGNTADSGRVKLYNKAVESDLSYDLTRLELTTTCTDYAIVLSQIPKVLICGDLDLLSSGKLSKSDYVLLQLLWLCDDPGFYFKQLGRDKQEKLKPYITSNFSLNFTEDVFNSLLSNVYYFKNSLNFE